MAARHSSFLIQSSHGANGNFELVVPRLGGGLAHYWRDNDDPLLPWHGPALIFGSADDILTVTLIQGGFGNLELVALEGSQLVHNWRDDGGTWRWQARTYLPGATDVVGGVALVQSSHGALGNYEVVAPLASGGLAHWWRDNDAAGLPWIGPTPFGAGGVDAAVMVQTTLGAAGNLELVAREGGQLVHYWRDDGASWAWQGPFPIAGGAAGSPTVIQSTYSGVGNLELVSPLAAGGLGHWTRDNDNPAQPWLGPVVFGSGNVTAVAVIQSKFGSPGNLELVARVGDQLVHYWRDFGLGQWFGPFPFGGEVAPDPTVLGQCTISYKPGLVGIHAALVRTGKLLVFGFSDNDATVGVSALLDPPTGAVETPPESHHLFCSGHAFLPDGRLVTMGGHHHDLASVHIFDPDPAQQSWDHVAEMENGRWYPTCTALSNGQVLTISGTKGAGGPISPTSPVNNTMQVYDGAAGLQPEQPLPVPFSNHFPPSFPTIDLYPFVYVLPSGHLLVHSRNTTRFYDLATGAWDTMQLPTAYPHSRTYPGQGSSVLLPLLSDSDPPYRARMLVIGGGGEDPENLVPSTPATATAEILDLGDPSPAWRFTDPMKFARVMLDAMLLPDGTVLAVGGSATGKADNGLDPVLEIELFDPLSETWTTMAPMRVPRSYHSLAILLADGRVLMAGKDGIFNPPPYNYPEHRMEVFSPPYLFRGPQPPITSAPNAVGYDTSFAVETPDPATIASAAFLRPGSVTHSNDMEQRYIGLAITARTTSNLTLQSPPNVNVAPPGHYMLFVLNEQGVPSIGKFVFLQ